MKASQNELLYCGHFIILDINCKLKTNAMSLFLLHSEEKSGLLVDTFQKHQNRSRRHRANMEVDVWRG